MFKYSMVCTLGLAFTGCGMASKDPIAETRQAEATCSHIVIRGSADASNAASCRNVEGDVLIEATSLSDMSAFGNLERISGSLIISGNANLSTLDGLNSLSSVAHLVLTGNTALRSIGGLSHLAHVNGVTIAASPSLLNLHGLESLETLDGLVLIHTGLTSLEGVNQLKRVGDLVLTDNSLLQNLDGLERLQSAENVDVERNRELSHISPFLGITTPCADGIVTRHWARVASTTLRPETRERT